MKITLDANAIMPTRAHATDAGLDLYAPKEKDEGTILCGGRRLIQAKEE